MEHTPDCRELVERIDDWRRGLQIDVPRRIVANVALTGLQSRNGYSYSEQALRTAVPLYENRPVFLDHAASRARPLDRSARDLVGTIVNARFADGRIRGDIRVLDTEAGRTFLALAEGDSPAVGMSHVVLARRDDARRIVEHIAEVVSVDAVVFPATTTRLHENQTATGDALPGSLEALLLDVDDALAAHLESLVDDTPAEVRRVALLPDAVLVETIADAAAAPQRYRIAWQIESGRLTLSNELQPVPDDDLTPASGWSALLQRATGGEENLKKQLEQAIAERDELRRQLDLREQRDGRLRRESRIEELLAESQLPDYAATEAFREQLLSAADDAGCRRLIAERLQLIRASQSRLPTSSERNEARRTTDELLIAAIRRRPGPGSLSRSGGM